VRLYPHVRKWWRHLHPSRPQGLATLSTVLARFTLGSLFQLPTLLGFTPSELFSVGWSRKGFPFQLPLLRFLTKPLSLGLVPALQRFHPISTASVQASEPGFSPGPCRLGSHGVKGLSGAPPIRPTKSAFLFVRRFVLSFSPRSEERREKPKPYGSSRTGLAFPRRHGCPPV
jgi:hypothetical protein